MKRLVILVPLFFTIQCATYRPRTPARVDSASCASLKGLHIPASAFLLSTAGADLTATDVINDLDESGHPRSYCRVLGKIRSEKSQAPDIQFQINLPENWNHKTLQMGGGGYNGSIVTGTTHVGFAPSEGATPLALGYMTFGSDSGHVGNSLDASFALNSEALLNFGYQHLKKTRDAAIVVAQMFYNTAPAKTYFAGASTGGREALTALQHWPNDYDGVIAAAPALNFTGVRMHGLEIGKALYRKDSFVNFKKQNLILLASLKACDQLDNLQDGIISDVEACKKIAVQTKDLGDDCLSDSQIASVQATHSALKLPYSLAHDVHEHEGYNILEGADFRGDWGFGSSTVLNNPPQIVNGYLFLQGSQWARFFLAQNSNFNSLSFDPKNPGRLKNRAVELSSIIGATNPAIENFLARKGKLILMHGQADAMISSNPTISYYEKLVKIFGRKKIQSAVQFYLVPGFGHGGGVFTMSWDPLKALDIWVTEGKQPEVLVGKDLNKDTRSRERPLCPYPGWPRYKGSGPKDKATSFTCENASQLK